MATIGETTTNSALTPIIELYTPTGGRLTYDYNAVGTTITSFNLPVTGTYVITVRDLNGYSVGGFAVTPVSIGTGITQNSGGDGGLIPSGSTRSATAAIGDIDAHPFYGVTGDKVVITVTESTTNSPLTPIVELYGPTGQRITYNYAAATTTITVNSLPSIGLYTITVRDLNGYATGGYKVLLTQTPSAIKPTITLAATDNLAVEGGFDNGTFTITRTNLRALPVTVGYTITGTAKNGVDYTTLTGSAIIPPNSASVNVNVSALVDSLKENSETVIVTLKTGSNYTLGSAKSATVTIDDGATISGSVFNDADGNGARNGSEAGLSGWKVWIDLDGDGVLDSNERSVTTDSTGAWKFTGLAPATYKVRVVKQSSWNQTLPAGGTFQSVVLGLGATKTGVVFGEKHV
jgi:hypothetical protein